MPQQASVSLSVLNQLPDFIKENSPLFEQFLHHYYKSQEKIGGPIGIVNNLTDYLNISSYDLKELDASTITISNTADYDTDIIVQNTDGFVENDGTILVDNEVIYYESIKKSPKIVFSSGISYLEFNKKVLELFNPYQQFNGSKKIFDLKVNNLPVFPPSANHLIVTVYGNCLRPNIDYTIAGSTIVFTRAPRTFDAVNLSDTIEDVSIYYLKGYESSMVEVMDLMTPTASPKNIWNLKINGKAYYPASDVLTIAVVDGKLLKPLQEYSIFEDNIIFKNAPVHNIYVGYINANLLSVGSGARAYTVVNNEGEVENIISSYGGSGYTLNNVPKVSITGGNGSYATAEALVGGIKNITLLESGSGYSKENPPYITIASPTLVGGSTAQAKVSVNDSGEIESISLLNSGSGYDFTPRIKFTNPTGAEVGNVVINSNNGVQSIQVIEGGFGYTTAPKIYIDPPTEVNGIQASAEGILNSDGKLVSVNILVAGRGYTSTPRVKVIQPTGAQILDVSVDDFGRVIRIELLSGGYGYTNVPSIYIVDDRKDNLGNFSGGSGAAAQATIFNGEIIDINITSFGEGYSRLHPPKIYISSTEGAKASAEIGEDEITGFNIISMGKNYDKSEFVNCSRGVSGIIGYDSEDHIIFKDESESIATNHPAGTLITSLDGIFYKKIIDKFINQYLPGLPSIDTNSLNLKNILSSIKDFYSSKGTVYSISYLFKLLYGSDIDVTYPKDQIIKPSASTWSIDTIIRCRLISGNPENLRDSLLEQNNDAVDTSVNYAKALIENYTAIQTANYDVYELIVSEESIEGKFVIPYATKLVQGLNPTDLIINVDSTIGWPERNGEIVIGSEIIRYKEKTLTQFIECTRGLNDTEAQRWDAGSIVNSNFYVYANQGTSKEVVLSIFGIVDANQTTLLEDGNYYLSGDKLTISKLGTTDDTELVNSWLYNVKKLLKVSSITYGGVNNQTATVTCDKPHGLLIGDQFTIYGANPIVYNGTFLVIGRESATVFKYSLPQPAVQLPQGNILLSIDLNTGKSNTNSINSSISRFPSNIQNTFLNKTHVYVAASGIPNYKIGPFLGTALLPGNQRKLYKFPRIPNTISVKTKTVPGPIASLVNGVSVWNYKSEVTYPFGPVTDVLIKNSGSGYDAAVPPIATFVGGGGTGASGEVVVNGSVVDYEVLNGGSGYTESPLVSVYGETGIGATGTAIITNGIVTKILVNTAGSGYNTEPTVAITGGGGSGAVAKAVVRGPIEKINITNSGSSYTSSPSLLISSGYGAAAQAYVSNGRIISIAIISAGFGYTTAPKVIITGDGYGAVAKATISTEGSELGRVTSITILNRGIGYKQGTTQIRLESVGEGAEFDCQIFEWTYNLYKQTTFDSANGSIFEGFNNQYGGEYAHIGNPKYLRYVLGDNLIMTSQETLIENTSVKHSPIIGWAFDGNPIYGPYGLQDPTSLSSAVVPIQSSYVLKNNLIYNENTNPNPVRIEGPSLVNYPAGTFVEDYEYTFNSLSVYLDQYNGRFCKTPEFPNGIYAYFTTLDAAGNAKFPYMVGPSYYSDPETWNLNQFATQSNIPTGVVRYRTPFEDVDIDIERVPNESTNALTLENGDLLLFEIEDENKDGIISQDEINDPNVLYEEQRLEVFDYFPKIETSSKVDIEIETTTKFEDAKITGFFVENAGNNYQVNDRLIFDDTGTSGYGASARISEIQGKDITSYTYEYNSTTDTFNAVVTTSEPHNLIAGDQVIMTTTPVMEPTSKTILVKSLSGIEKVTVTDIGTGYNPDMIPDVSIESNTGQYGKITPIVTSAGTIEEFSIVNSGIGYDSDPIVRVSHPQIERRADYFLTTHVSDANNVKFNGSFAASDKTIYLVGSGVGSDGNTSGILQKLNTDGSTYYSKSLSSTQPGTPNNYCELVSACKNGTSVYVVGRTKPNASLNNAYNPDILVAKYTENSTGSAANLTWQREFAGISGITRSDIVTDIASVGDNIVIVGYTNTNTTSVYDGFLIYMNSSGDVITKRKITSASYGEKITSVRVDSNNNIFVVGTYSDTNILVSKLYLSGNRLLEDWSKSYSYTGYKFTDVSAVIDEYDQIYVTSCAESISTGDRKVLHFMRLSNVGDIIKSQFNGVSNSSISITPSKCSIDVFGEISVAYTSIDTNLTKTIGVVKFQYDGFILDSSTIAGPSGTNLLRKGFESSICVSDASGDPIIVGQIYDNRTQFLYNASSTYNDATGRNSALTTSGTVSTTSDSKYGTLAYSISLSGRLDGTSSLTTSSWTLDGWYKYDSLSTTKTVDLITIVDGSNTIIVQQEMTSGSNYGKIRTKINTTTGTWSTATNSTTLMNGQYAFISLTKSLSNNIATYTVYVNGTQFSQQTSSTNIKPAVIRWGSTTSSSSHPLKLDDLRLSSYDTTGIIATAAAGKNDYGSPSGFVFKTDKNLDSARMGNITFTNNGLTINRSAFTFATTQQDVVTSSATYPLASEGFQILDVNVSAGGLTQNYVIPTITYDLWSSRTATIPAVGGTKVKVQATVLDKFFFNHFAVNKNDNVKKITLNQSFDFNINKTLIQKNSLGATIATARILEKDLINQTISIGDITGTFVTNSGSLVSSDEFVNEITAYTFANKNATTPGTFDFVIPGGVSAVFKPYSDDDYLIRIDAITTGSSYIVGSVVTVASNQVSFTSDKKTATITGLTAVTQISLVTNLTKILKITTINNTDLVFFRTETSHYLKPTDIISTTSNPPYNPLSGTFDIYSILSKKEFILQLRGIPVSTIGSSLIKLYVKNPIFKFIYGQQYTFDTSDSSMQGHYLSFYRDNLYKIEYTFKNITRKGTPGFDEPGNSPFISFKLTSDAANITYYADPSNLTSDGPVNTSSYIDVITSPYIGTYTITELQGGTVTQGPNKFKFELPSEPEKTAVASSSSYSTTSVKTVGPIAKVKLVNGGGFYKKLPQISDIQSSRKIERVEIVEPGTEYAAGEYFGVPILGDGTGGKVSIVVDGTTDPAGQIVEVTVTDPGKGYTYASIDVDAVDGILGPLLQGSGAILDVIIPPKGTGAAIYTRGTNVGKIKKLRNNNFGFNYTHDYTLRPEITFPVNVQLSNTSILSSIKITDPGTGYTTPPEVIITGGGGSGASAEAYIKNGRISDILVKNPGTGYSTPPTITLKSSFNYVVNLDLGLFQFAFPHGIPNGAQVQFQVESLGPTPQFPLTSFGYLSATQIYYAISGESNGLQDDQLRIALTEQDAISGNYIAFVSAGVGRQIILTSSFGGAAESVVETGRFLSNELVFQGESFENSSAIGYVSTNEGWQTGPRLLKLVNTSGTFTEGLSVTGLISKASGTIENISVAKGVLEVNSLTKTVGKFLDDVGKPSEIVQKIQDSYLYQQFSYNIKSPVSIELWRDTVIDNVHPAGFKVFGEIDIEGGGKGLVDKTEFELTKSVNLVESSVVANIKDYAIVQPVYSEFDNTQILFRNKRLTSSEEILTSVVQRLDDISSLFDGERTIFPATIDGNTVVANTNQFLLTLNGVAQPAGTAFEVQQGSIVFSEPPPAPTKISYASVTVQFLTSTQLNISNVSGILPELGSTVRGLVSNVSATVIRSTSNTLVVYNISGSGFQLGETLIVAATGLNCTLSSINVLTNKNLYKFKESITNIAGDTAVVEEINLSNNVATNKIIISKTSGTYKDPSGLLNIKLNDYIYSASSLIIAKVIALTPYKDPVTQQFVSSIAISDPSTFTGLLFTREINPLKPNAIVDDISKSVIEVTNLLDDTEKYETNFVAYENAENIILDYHLNSRTTKSLTVSGNAAASTTQKKFGTGSIVFDGSGDYITAASSSDFAWGTNPFTYEVWVYRTASGTYQTIFDSRASAANETAVFVGITTTNLLYVYINNTIVIQGATTVAANTWTHVALCRSAGGLKLFQNGVQVGSTYSTSLTFAAKPVRIGADYQGGYGFTGYLDEIRVSNNARYTTTFTPSVTPYSNDPYTVLLIHGNGSIADDGGSSTTPSTGELLQSIKIGYTNQTGHFAENETIYIKKLSYHTLTGGNFISGNTVTGGTSGATATIIGVNYALKFLYLGSKTGTFTLGETITSGAVSAKASQYLETPFDTKQVDTTEKTIITPQIDLSGQNRYRDAANLIRQNQTYIIEEAVGRMKAKYPDLLIPGDSATSSDGTNRCKLDLSLLIDAVCTDLEYGGNYNTTLAGRYYLDENGGIRFIRLQLLQSLYVHTQVNALCQQAIAGTLSQTPTYTKNIPYLPLNITTDPGGCANVKSTIDTLWNLINDILAPTGQVYRDAADRIWSNRKYIAQEATGYVEQWAQFILNNVTYNAFTYPSGSSSTCERDLQDYILPSIITDLLTGGNANILDAMTYYVGSNSGGVSYVKNEILPTVVAIERANLLCQYAIDNWIVNGTTATSYVGLTGSFAATATRTTDNTITADNGTYGGNCEQVKQTIDTLFNLSVNALIPERNTKYGRYYDASNLINSNKYLIADVAVGRMKANYPTFTIPNGDAKCKTDIVRFMDAIIYDLRQGGNARVYDTSQIYTFNSYLVGEEVQSNYAFNQARDIALQIIDNVTVTLGGYTTYTQVKDLTIIADPYLATTAVTATAATTKTATGTSGASTITVSNNTGLVNGMAVSGTGIRTGAYITNISGTTVTLSGTNTGAVSGTITFGAVATLTFAAQSSAPFTVGDTIVVAGIAPSGYNGTYTVTACTTTSVTYANTTTGSQTIAGTVGSNTAAGSCADVKSAITTLTSILTTAVTNKNMTHATRQTESDLNKVYRDAAKLVLFNKEYIKNESLQKMKLNYPGFNVPGGNSKCLRDIGYIIDAIVFDLLTYGNKGIVDATLSYIDATTGSIVSLDGELIQSIYTYTQVKDLIKKSISKTLTVPSPSSGSYAYTDSSISITGTNLTTVQAFTDARMDILLNTLNNSQYININQIVGSTAEKIQTPTYPTRSAFTPIKGGANVGDYIYGESSGKYGEVEYITFNRAKVTDQFKKVRIQYADPNEIFTNNTVISVQGQPTKTARIFSSVDTEFYSDLDLSILTGTFAVGQTLIDDNGYLATITDIDERIQLSNLIGEFEQDQFIYGLTSTCSIYTDNFEYNNAPIISTLGSKLTLDTEGLVGSFVKTRKVLSSLSSHYVDVIDIKNYQLDINDVFKTTTVTRLTVNYNNATERTFLSEKLLQDTSGIIPGSKSATIIGTQIIDSNSLYIYIGNIVGTFTTGNTVAVFQSGVVFPVGSGTITAVTVTNSIAYASIVKIVALGNGYRFYLTDVIGTLSPYSQIVSKSNYKALIKNVVKIEGRIKRSFVGFNGQQTTFKLTQNNGEAYFPDEEGYMLVFVNGILQPPTVSFIFFNDTIEFTEAPTLGSSFHAIYYGKLRQLDDISYQFDSLRNTFNLKLNDSFYSLTITEGISSTSIKPENNIIISLNGVIQEPGVAYQLVGSRIIFAEVPRVGSTFVAFSYIGSDVDVIAAEVVPPIEVTDKLEIEGETEDRTVAIIESSNSLITFDYLGSVLGRNASAVASLVTGRVSDIQLTSGGAGYTSRPIVSFNSLTGFDAQAKALIGISRVVVVDKGHGYAYPTIDIDNTIPAPPIGFNNTFDDVRATFDTNTIRFDEE